MINVAHGILHRTFTPSLKITFSDRDVVNVDKNGIGLQNTSMADASDGSTLPIGAAIGKTLTIELLNDSGEWAGYDFFGASIDLTLTYDTGDIVTYRNWTVQQPPEDLGTYITIVCVDEMWRTDKPYTTQLSYPASVGAVWREACSKCGLSNATTTAAVFNDSIAAPLAGDLTFRQVFGFIAGIAGGNAHIRPDGKIEIKRWYIPDASTDTTQHPTHVFDDWINLTPALHDVTITGISAVIQNDDGEDETILVGTDDYVIQLEGNPLITADNAQRYLGNILAAVGGKAIRPYTGDLYFCPVAEFGDPVAIITQAGSTVYSVITSISWPLGGKTALQCALEVPLSAGRQYVDPSLQALIAAKKMVAKERTEREQAVISLQTALANSSGMYKTEQQQSDGSIIYYLHDKPTLAASSNVIKLASEAIALSTDGGSTYPYGFQITGDMVVRLLSATGVNADWIDTGALVVKDDNGKILFSADVGAGQVYIDGISVDDGVVTVGVNDATYKTVITPNEMAIKGKNKDLFNCGLNGVKIPSLIELADGAAIQAGRYQIVRVDDGIQVLHKYSWTDQPDLATPDILSQVGNVHFQRDDIVIAHNTDSSGITTLTLTLPIASDEVVDKELELRVSGTAKYFERTTGELYSTTLNSRNINNGNPTRSIAAGWSGEKSITWEIRLLPGSATLTYESMYNIQFSLVCNINGTRMIDWYLLTDTTYTPILKLQGATVSVHKKLAFEKIDLVQMVDTFQDFYNTIYPVGVQLIINSETRARNVKNFLQSKARSMYRWNDGTERETCSITWTMTQISGTDNYVVERTA